MPRRPVRHLAAAAAGACLLAGLLAAPVAAVPPPDDDPPEATIRVAIVGDVMLGRSIGDAIDARGPRHVLAAVRDRLAGADLAIANLECAITPRWDPVAKRYTFRAPPAAADALRLGGIDVVTVANNHALDMGRDGFRDTLRILADAGIGVVGGGLDRAAATAPLVVPVGDLRVAILGWVDGFPDTTGFTTLDWEATRTRPGLAIARPAAIARAVRAARAEAEIVIVLVHAGYELVPRPNAEQRAYARAAIAAGADLVVGHHPHVLQGGEARRDGRAYVAWSLGNFVFDRMSGASETAILSVTLAADGVRRVRWIPVRLDAAGLPVPVAG